MRLISTLPLFVAVMPFAADAVSIAVNATVDSHIASVTVKAGSQTMTIAAGGSATWTGWTVDADYTLTFTGVADGYTGKWKVTADGVSELSGGANEAITLSQSYAGCTLSFYGEPNTYRVKFERQGGSGDFSVTAAYNTAMPSITPPTRTGYDFGGYYSEANGGGTQYYNADGTSAHVWDVAADSTLYAKWTASDNSVTLDRRLGVGGTRSVVATYGSAMPEITPPTRLGHEFQGYRDAPSDGTQYYNADGSSKRNWNKTEPTTLYAQWKAKTSKVSLNRQGGNGGDSSVTATYGFPMPSANMPSHDGWTFKGFTSQPDGTGVRYYNAKGASARKWDCTTNTTLYAQWAVNEYAVTLNPNGGSGGTESVTAAYGAAMPVVAIPTRPGYEFCSYTTSDGGASYYNADGSSAREWDIASNATLYAQWTVQTYKVTFDANGGEGAMDPITCTYDVPTNLTECTFTRDGWGFSGWSNSVSGVLLEDKALVSNLTETAGAEVSLFACWTGITYKVTLDARDPYGRGNGVLATNEDGEAVVVTDCNVTVGKPWNLPTDPNTFTNVNPSLTFAGWTYTNSENAVANLDWSLPVPPPSAGTTNLIAKWSNPLADALDAPTLLFETFGTEGSAGHMLNDTRVTRYIWITNFVEGTTVAQSGDDLPSEVLSSSPAKFYGSWLTTKLSGAGTLTFLWKCDALPLDGSKGNKFYCGPYEGDWNFNLRNYLDGASNGWYSVTYDKTSAGEETFAWAFLLEGRNNTNGGGTGYVDHVEWVPTP